MRLQHFADFSAIFQERSIKPLWERYPLRESDTWDSLGLFLEGYAFERQGRRPDYGPAAADAVVQAKSKGERLETTDVPQALWDCFKHYLGNSGLNKANNPLCPKETSYSRKNRLTHTNKQSAVEFLRSISDDGIPPNIVLLAKAELERDRLKAVHEKIKEINGIGPKIASLFLRDVSTFYNIFPSKDRQLLQPIDVWVRRIVKELGGPANDQDIGTWIVRESANASVNPETVNQGMWYFATQIAGSYHRLKASIHDLSRAEELFEQHKRALNGGAQAAGIIRIQP